MAQAQAADMLRGEDKRRAVDVALDAKAACEALGETRLAGAQVSDEEHDLAAPAARADSFGDGLRRIGGLRHHILSKHHGAIIGVAPRSLTPLSALLY